MAERDAREAQQSGDTSGDGRALPRLYGEPDPQDQATPPLNGMRGAHTDQLGEARFAHAIVAENEVLLVEESSGTAYAEQTGRVPLHRPEARTEAGPPADEAEPGWRRAAFVLAGLAIGVGFGLWRGRARGNGDPAGEV